MAKRKKKILETRICNTCGTGINTTVVGLASIDVMITHYKTKHPDRKARCFDDYGQTWDAQYDQCLKALHNTTDKLNQAIKERDLASGQQRTLAAKLNAIIMILENRQGA